MEFRIDNVHLVWIDSDYRSCTASREHRGISGRIVVVTNRTSGAAARYAY